MAKEYPEPTQAQIDAAKTLFGEQKCKAMAGTLPSGAINWAKLIAFLQAIWPIIVPFLEPAPTPPVPNVP